MSEAKDKNQLRMKKKKITLPLTGLGEQTEIPAGAGLTGSITSPKTTVSGYFLINEAPDSLCY